MAHLWTRKPRQILLFLRLASLCALIAGVYWVFRLIPQHQFVNWDDPSIFPEFLSGRWLSRRSLVWVLDTDGGDWQPLARLLLVGQAAFVGVSSFAVHGSSLVCHGLNAVLLFIVVEKILGLKRPTAEHSDLGTMVSCLLAVCVVMLHPLRVEPVAWAAGLATLWSTTFVLLGVMFFLNLIQSPQNKLHALLAVFFVLSALLIKPNAISAVVWLCMLAWYTRHPEGVSIQTRRPLIWGAVIVSMAAALLVVLLTAYTRQKFQDHPDVKLLSLVDALPRMGYAFGYYVQKTLLPSGLSPFVGWPTDLGVTIKTALFGLLVFLALVFWFRRRQGVLLLLLAFVVGLAPALGVLKLGRFVAADRYSYVASMALAPLFAGFFLWLTERRSQLGSQVAWVGSAALVIGLGLASFYETKAWRDSRSLWEHALEQGGGIFADVHSNYGGALEAEGKYAEALAAYERAIAIDPIFPDAHIGRAVVLYRLGRLDEAISEAEIAVKYGGDYIVAWQNLGAFLVAKKRYKEAEPVVEKALRLAPESPSLLFLSGQLSAQAGNYAEARAFFERTLAVKPDWVDPQIALGAMFVLLGQKDQGRVILEKAVQMHPESAAARATLDTIIKSN